jgi:hypothetical protein
MRLFAAINFRFVLSRPAPRWAASRETPTAGRTSVDLCASFP